MVSDRDDSAAPGGGLVGVEALLGRVGDATRVLAVSETIPVEVADLVDSFDTVLCAADPARGLGGVDPYLAEALLGGAVVCLKALRHDDPATARRQLRVGLEQVRRALCDIAAGVPAGEDRPAGEVLAALADTVSSPQAELADLLGVSARTLQRWLSPTGSSTPTGTDAARVRVAAALAGQLRHSFTGPGVMAWFARPHPHLDGARPVDLLADPAHYPHLVRVAAGARSMVAT